MSWKRALGFVLFYVVISAVVWIALRWYTSLPGMKWD